jgi:hypothetical protein
VVAISSYHENGTNVGTPVGQARTDESLPEEVKARQDKMEAVIKSSQEKMEVAVHSIRSELEETIRL